MIAPERYAFGPFVLDVNERTLMRNGSPVPLRGKVFDTLVVLVRNSRRLVSKEELVTAVWPDTFVSESNLLHNISVIRGALGEPDCIQTVPKQGYRFTAGVTPVLSVPLRKRLGHLAAIAAALVLVGLSSVAAYVHRRVPPPSSVAVLPFDPLNLTAGQTYLARGFGSAIANRLGGMHGLTVRPAGGAHETDPETAARRLDVECVLTGRVQTAGGSLRVMAELFDARKRQNIWSRTFDITPPDIPAIEDVIATDVGLQIEPSLSDIERARLTRPASRDREAADLYLRGRDLLDRRIRFEEAARDFELAIRRDPRFALAWAGLAEALAYPSPMPAESVIDRATAAAKTAIALDPSTAEAHATLGFIHLFYDWEYAAADRELRRALALNGGSARFHDWLAIAFLTQGRFGEARAELARARRIDPAAADIVSDVELVDFLSHHYGEAEADAREFLAVAADPHVARERLVEVLAGEHRYKEALIQLASIPPYRAGGQRALVRYAAGEIALADALRIANELERSEGETTVANAVLYARLGDRESALRCLRRALDRREFGLIFIGVEPAFDPLRGDPRFRDVLVRAGFPQRNVAASALTSVGAAVGTTVPRSSTAKR